MLGLGSILCTGIFVSIGIAAGAAGPAVIIAIILAAALARTAQRIWPEPDRDDGAGT